MNFLSAWQDLHGRHMTTHYTIRINQLTQRTRHSTQTTGTNETHLGSGGRGWRVCLNWDSSRPPLNLKSTASVTRPATCWRRQPTIQINSLRVVNGKHSAASVSQPARKPAVPWIERRKKMDSPCHTTAQRYARRDDDYTGRQVGRWVQVSPPHTHHRYQRCTAMRGWEGERRTEKWNTTL